MRLTGTNTLYVPRVSQANYLFENVLVDNTGVYSFSSTHYILNSNTGSTVPLFKLSGSKVLNPSGRFVSTYNTGEQFDVGGWLDFSRGWRYLQVNNILSRTPDLTITSGVLGSISVECPTNGSIVCDVFLTSPYVESTVSFSNVENDGFTTGTIYSTADMLVTGGNLKFYQSYEQLLTGGPLVAFLDSRFPNWVYYQDNDTSFQNNSLLFDYSYSTTFNNSISEISILRSGLYGSGIYQNTCLSTGSGFSGLFDGFWENNAFSFNDSGNPIALLDLDYLISLTDVNSNPYPVDVSITAYWYGSGLNKKAEYITGFQLDAQGEYMNIPDISVTGYYYSTGILQDIDSLLFSSGCTGDLLVTFSNTNGYGTGASGLLVLNSVFFSGVYGNGVKQYNLVSAYTSLDNGSGYTMPPRATVNTGQYGATCFDVPNTSGYNYAWYRPFRTSGTIDVEAGWFSGVALCQTGLVSGGALTGYLVTGIDVYNIGSGYSQLRQPLISFVRKDIPTGLTTDASGTLLMKTGTLFVRSGWKIETGLAGSTLTPMLNLSGSTCTLQPPTNQITIRLSTSGSDITEPLSGYVNVQAAGIDNTVTFIYSKYFPTGGDALKKKNNAIAVYPISQELGFGLTLNELDILYSAVGYVNNNWPFTSGDFDF